MSVSNRRVPIRTKIRILQEYNRGVLPQSIASKFGVSKSLVYKIRRNEGLILENYKSLKDPNNKVVEKALYEWYVAQREAHIYVREKDLMAKATELHKQMYNAKFHANRKWLGEFKSRFEIRFDEKYVSKDQLMANFKAKLANIMRERKLRMDAIFKAEVSGLFWTSLPSSKFCADNVTEMPRERITFLVCLNASATRKLTPFAVSKVRQPLSFRNRDVPIDYAFSDSALIVGNIIVNWFFDKFVPQVEAFLVAENLPQQAVLLLDKMPGYPSEELLTQETADGEIRVMYLPPATDEPPFCAMDASTFTKLWYKKFLLHKTNRNNFDICSASINISLFDMALLLLLSWQKVPTVFLHKLCKKIFSTEKELEEEDDTPLAELRTPDEGSIVSETMAAVNRIFAPEVYTLEDIWRWITLDRHLDDNLETEMTDSEDEYTSSHCDSN